MRIFPPQKTETSSSIEVRARVEERRGERDLWFRFQKPLGLDPSSDLDSFAVALVLVAMQQGEDLELEGTISKKLSLGLESYQAVFSSWFPERFKKIQIRPQGLREDPPPHSRLKASAFSGGVDSFYSYFKLKPLLSHTLFMSGFDMPLGLVDSIRALTDSYSRFMDQEQTPLITGSTNVRTFVNTADWTNSHGQALAASALFFKESFGTFFIPASYTGGTYPKWGTHPDLDAHLSTESMEFQHHGKDANRVQKLKEISQHKESYQRLRVCWIQDIGLKNCGECEKCVRTMASLEILGVLDRYKTFPSQGFLLKKLRSLPYRTHQSRVFAKELVKEALLRQKFGVASSIAYSLFRREWNRLRVESRWRA